MAETVVEGLAGLQRAFAFAERDIRLDLRASLREAAEPVRADSETLAVQRITNIGVPWSRMRVGVTRTLVYVAPRERGTKGRGNQRFRRPNLRDLLLDRAMNPALDQNQSQIETRVVNMLNDFAVKWSRIG